MYLDLKLWEKKIFWVNSEDMEGEMIMVVDIGGQAQVRDCATSSLPLFLSLSEGDLTLIA
jgi:hypothetical protein